MSFISQMVKQISFPPPIFSLHLKQADMIWSKTKRHCNNLFSKNGCSCYWYYTWIEKWTTLYYKPHIFFTIHMQDYCSVEDALSARHFYRHHMTNIPSHICEWPIFLLSILITTCIGIDALLCKFLSANSFFHPTIVSLFFSSHSFYFCLLCEMCSANWCRLS